MTQRAVLKRIAMLLAGALLATQLAIAAHACPKVLDSVANAAMQATASADRAAMAAAMPDCDGSMDTPESAPSNLCAEHCKQGQQGDRAHAAVAVPPALLNVLYETPAVPAPAPHRPLAAAWLSALVAASPPHAIAHCVLRI